MPFPSPMRPCLALAAISLVALAGCDPYAASPGAHAEGRVRAYVVDYEDGTSRTGYALESESGVYTELEPSPEVEAHVGARVSVRGRLLDTRLAPVADDVHAGDARMLVDSLRVTPSAGVAASTEAITNGAPRTIRVAAILINFQGVTPQAKTKAQVEGYLSTVRAYYQEISYGIWNIEPTVFGPFTIAKPVDCDLGRIGTLARDAAAANGVSLTPFDHVAVTLPANGDSGLDCACGVAWVGRTPAQNSPEVQRTSLYTCIEANAFAHELGHAFGLQHASVAHCNGVAFRRNLHQACEIEEYGNLFNVMGNGLGHMSAFQKTTMKWLDRCNNVRVSRNAVFELVPIQVASEGVQSLQIPLGDSNAGTPLYYYVEYRNPSAATFNAKDGNTLREKGPGVHIDVAQGPTVSGADGRPILLDLSTGTPNAFVDPRLTPGRTYADPDGRVSIAVLEATGASARVEVSFPGGGTGANTCQDGTSPPGTPQSSTAATFFQHCDFGGWSIALPPGDYTRAQLLAAGALDNDASSLNVAPGYEVVLYDGTDFTGDSVTLRSSTSCLVGNAFNDRVSSARVRLIPVVGTDAGVPVMDGSVSDDASMPVDAATHADAGMEGVEDAGTPGSGGPNVGGCATASRAEAPRSVLSMLAILLALVVRRKRTAGRS